MLDILKIGLKLLDMKLESSKKFYEDITQKFQEKKSILEKRYNEEEVGEESFEDIRDTLVDDYQEQQEFENLASMLVVSHNYFILEYFLKLLVRNLLKQKGDPKFERYKNLYMEDIAKFFKKKGILFINIQGYSDCNILRLLVNDIKHNGARVSRRLAKAKGEPFNENEIKEIKIFPDEVDKYSEAIRVFYGNLINRVITGKP
ncbi:MAG: hypothetical protein KJ568_01445 [Actinobacteria bacterium]|nr:hypothetical protein [Actinomycetota bacterium]